LCFAKCCGLSLLLRRHFFQYYPNNNWVIALLQTRERSGKKNAVALL
jgi:hypothetical protein